MSDPTVVAGAVSSNIYTSNEKPIDMYSKMFENYPELTPLVSILTKVGDNSTSQSTVYWTEQEELPTKVTVSTLAASGATEIIVPNYAYLRKNDLLFNPDTFELIRVTATPTTSTVAVTKGVGATADYAVDAGQELEILLPAYEENYDETNPRAAVNTEFYNYTAEIVEFVQTSNRVQHEATHFSGPGGKRLENQQKMFRAFRIKAEKALLFSYRADFAGTTNNIKTMGGIVEKLHNGTNYWNVNGLLTESALDDYLVQLYESMPDREKLTLVCSPKLHKIICAIAKPHIEVSPNSTEYGMKLMRYVGSIEVDLVRHPLLVGPTMSGWGLFLDFNFIKLIYQQRPQLHLDTYIKRAGYIEDKYEAMMTMLMSVEKRHGFITGVTG